MNVANINIKYKGLTGLHNDLTIDNGQTMTQLRTAIITDEGLQSYYYGPVSIHKNGTVVDSTDSASTTLVNAGIIAGDIITVATDREQTTRERSQLMMLDIAALKRTAGGDTTKPYYRAGNTHDRTLLPTRYVGDTVTDNTGDSGNLTASRPWT
jgi:hypothetical protein